MAHVDREGDTLQRVSVSLVSRSAGPAFTGLLGVVVLSRAAGGPQGLFAWHIVALFLLFAGSLMTVYHLYRSTSMSRAPRQFPLQLALLVALLAVLYQSRNPGFGLGVHRDLELAAVYLIVVGFCVLAADPREYTHGQWLVIGCYATVVVILFYHSADIVEASLRSRHPLWWGLLAGINLLVLPRYLSREQFLWSLNRLAAVLVVLALPIYVVGEYSLFGLPFTFHYSYTLPLIGSEVRATRSLFTNRNTFAAVLFAGIVAGTAELHRRLDRERLLKTAALPSVLLAVNVFGFALAYDLKLWLLAPGMLAIYVAYVAFGREAVPYAVGGAVGYVAAGLYLVYTGVLPLDDNNRFLLWDAGVRAIRHRPLYLGEGLIVTGEWLDPFHSLGPVSPHNSYISIWLRTGIVGGVAYVLLVTAGIVRGALNYHDVDVALLVLAFGFAVHQLFEAYTLFQTGTSSVLATLAVGYLVFGLSRDEDDEAGDDLLPAIVPIAEGGTESEPFETM